MNRRTTNLLVCFLLVMAVFGMLLQSKYSESVIRRRLIKPDQYGKKSNGSSQPMELIRQGLKNYNQSKSYSLNEEVLDKQDLNNISNTTFKQLNITQQKVERSLPTVGGLNRDQIVTSLNDAENPSGIPKNFTLFLRTFNGLSNFYWSFVVRSLKYFWLDFSLPMLVVLDNESEKDHEFGKMISDRYPYPTVKYEEPMDRKIYNYKGYNRQQLTMLYADKFTSHKYIGFIDTDTLFVTTVTSDLVFEDGKPLILGQYGPVANSFWGRLGEGTLTMFKTKEVMRCMSYFPVVIRRDHLIDLRNYVENLHNTTFYEVFRTVTSTSRFSQFNMMCQFLWFFKRDDYKWRLQLRDNHGRWTGDRSSEFRQPFKYYKENVKPEHGYPLPRSSVHYKYLTRYKHQTKYRAILTQGLCYSGGFELCPQLCEIYNENKLHRDLYDFEFSDWSWDKRCMEAQQKHYDIVKKRTTVEYTERLRKACSEVDNITFNMSTC